jgi:two-component system alkaline phosphatase synthesis response regulator PhoP
MSTPRETILIIEDDPVMLRGLRDNFEFEGYRVQTASDGDAGLKAALALQPDLIILDLMLPKLHGLQVCRMLKSSPVACHIPVLILSALESRRDKLKGFELGADDYVGKTSDISELLARVEVLLKRSEPDDCQWQSGLTLPQS